MVKGSDRILGIFSRSRSAGWVLEPDAKLILSLRGIPTPEFRLVSTRDEALSCAQGIGYPLVAKVVSPYVPHKSEVHGVAVGIRSDAALLEAFERFSSVQGFEGMLMEKLVKGVELFLGARIDYQFGPVVLLGIGGTGVEIYRDISIRMAPLEHRDVQNMAAGLRGHKLLEGYRGAPGIDMAALTDVMLTFSRFIMDFQDSIESVDINPLLCSPEACIAADSRIILSRETPDQ